MSEGGAGILRVAIIGSCQVAGLAATARALLPGAEVSSWHVGVHPAHSDAEMLELLPGFDCVISQLSDWDHHEALRITRLRERGLPVVFLPGMVFPGFHPDVTYLRGPHGMVRGLTTEYHSLIVASSYALGIEQARVSSLFNAYIFAELGYFEVFDAARAALSANFQQEGYDIVPIFDRWLKTIGQFMYTMNHPHIDVLADLCLLALSKAGQLDPSITAPTGIRDDLAAHFTWPTYTALARRIGVPGSMVFLRNSFGPDEGKPRELLLADYIAACYKIYATVDKDVFDIGDAGRVKARLATLVQS